MWPLIPRARSSKCVHHLWEILWHGWSSKYRNENRPTFKNKLTFIFCCKGHVHTFLSKVRPPICAMQYMQHARSTEEAALCRGETNKWRHWHHLLLLHKQSAWQKRHCRITACIHRARLTACEMGTTLENTVTFLLEEPLIFGRLWYNCVTSCVNTY